MRKKTFIVVKLPTEILESDLLNFCEIDVLIVTVRLIHTTSKEMILKDQNEVIQYACSQCNHKARIKFNLVNHTRAVHEREPLQSL